MMIERRSGKKRRGNEDRRSFQDIRYKDLERRSGRERRLIKDRRKS